MEGVAQNWWSFVALGVCAGVVSGMLGVGGGIVIIPALVLVMHLPQKSAQGMCLAAMVPMVAVGAIRYKLNPSIEVDMASAALLALGGVAGAFVGVEIVTRLPGGVLRKIFACFIIVVGLRMLFTPGRAKPSNDAAPAVQDEAGLDQVSLGRRSGSLEGPARPSGRGREQAPGGDSKTAEGGRVQARTEADADRLARGTSRA